MTTDCLSSTSKYKFGVRFQRITDQALQWDRVNRRGKKNRIQVQVLQDSEKRIHWSMRRGKT